MRLFTQLPQVALVPGLFHQIAVRVKLPIWGVAVPIIQRLLSLRHSCLPVSKYGLTDVDGFMTADPRVINNTYVIEQLSFTEAMELCNFGAKGDLSADDLSRLSQKYSHCYKKYVQSRSTRYATRPGRPTLRR